MKIYVAGPMSGYDDFNFPAFDAASAKLRAEGHEVFSPADEDRRIYGSMENIKAKANYRDCLRVDLNWILDHAEAIALLPGWEYSKGANAERALAIALGIEIMELKGAQFEPRKAA
jgi:nucleoside 2-deoxyribosyltransferase